MKSLPHRTHTFAADVAAMHTRLSSEPDKVSDSLTRDATAGLAASHKQQLNVELLGRGIAVRYKVDETALRLESPFSRIKVDSKLRGCLLRVSGEEIEGAQLRLTRTLEIRRKTVLFREGLDLPAGTVRYNPSKR